MKIKTAPARYEDVIAMPPAVHKKPRRANFICPPGFYFAKNEMGKNIYALSSLFRFAPCLFYLQREGNLYILFPLFRFRASGRKFYNAFYSMPPSTDKICPVT